MGGGGGERERERERERDPFRQRRRFEYGTILLLAFSPSSLKPERV